MITANLSIEDLGYIALFELCISPAYIFSNFSISTIIKAKWNQLNFNQKNSLISFFFISSSLLSIITILPIVISPDQIYYAIFGNRWDAIKSLLPFIQLSIIFIIPKEIFNSWSIVENKISLNNKVNLFSILLNTIVIVSTSLFTKDYIHVIQAYFYSRVLIGLIQTIIIFSNVKFLIDKKLFIETTINGFSIYLSTILDNLTPRINNLIVSHYFSISLFAYYNISISIYHIYNELLEHFQSTTDKFVYDNSDNRITNDYIIINSIWSYLVTITLILFIPTGKSLLNLFSNGLFYDCYNFILIISSIIISGLPFLGNQQILIKNNLERYIFMTSLFKNLTIVILSIYLVPQLGAKGILVSIWFGNFIFNFLVLFKKYNLRKKFNVKKEVIYFAIFYHIWMVSYFSYNISELNIFYVFANIVFFFMYCLKNRHKISQLV